MPVPKTPKSSTPTVPEAPKAPKTPEISGTTAENVMKAMSTGNLKDFLGIKKIMEYVKKKDWPAVVGAVYTAWKELTGTPEEQAAIAKARKEATDDETKRKAKGKLGELHAKVDAKNGEKNKGKVAEGPILNPKLGDGKGEIYIGDSAANDMHKQHANSSFIGEDGMTTFKVWEALQAKAKEGFLEGMEKARIYCGGNNIFGTPTDKLVEHMIKMADICKANGVSEVIVNTQLPPDPRLEKVHGEKKFAELIQKNEDFRVALLKAKKDGRLSGVKVIDLTTPYSNDEGKMQEKFLDPDTKDPLHTRVAYRSAIGFMNNEPDESTVA